MGSESEGCVDATVAVCEVGVAGGACGAVLISIGVASSLGAVPRGVVAVCAVPSGVAVGCPKPPPAVVVNTMASKDADAAEASTGIADVAAGDGTAATAGLALLWLCGCARSCPVWVVGCQCVAG